MQARVKDTTKIKSEKNVTMSYDNNILYTVDKWSQYDNPEEGAEQAEGDIHVSRKSRKTITTDKALLWTNGVVNYYVHSSIGENSHFFDNFKSYRNNNKKNIHIIIIHMTILFTPFQLKIK